MCCSFSGENVFNLCCPVRASNIQMQIAGKVSWETCSVSALSWNWEISASNFAVLFSAWFSLYFAKWGPDSWVQLKTVELHLLGLLCYSRMHSFVRTPSTSEALGRWCSFVWCASQPAVLALPAGFSPSPVCLPSFLALEYLVPVPIQVQYLSVWLSTNNGSFSHLLLAKIKL